MKREKALGIGHERAEKAAETIRQATGVQAMAVTVIKPGSGRGGWQPVGKKSWKEIARDDGFVGGGRYHLLVVDEDGKAKACSKDRLSLEEALRLAEKLPLPVARTEWGELARLLEERDLGGNVREHALHVEV